MRKYLITVVLALAVAMAFAGCATLDQLNRGGKEKAVQILITYVCDTLEERGVLDQASKNKYCPIIERVIVSVLNEEKVHEDDVLIDTIVTEIVCSELVESGKITEEQGDRFCPLVSDIVVSLVDKDKEIPIEDIVQIAASEIAIALKK